MSEQNRENQSRSCDVKPIPRRDLLGAPGVLFGSTLLGINATEQEILEEKETAQPRQKILVVGGHPDDPETGCGGTMARFSTAGHEVAAVYLTRGEYGIKGKSPEETARIRTSEAEQACRILGVRPIFAGQICSHAETSNQRYAEFHKIIQEEDPDMMFTHWPIDSHRDHRAASMLAFDSWLALDRSFDLFFYEVYSGIQTQTFSPTHYVDITHMEPRKRSATYAHVSQKPDQLYRLHDLMNRFRGTEYRCQFAEAFVRHVQGSERDFRF